MTTLVFLPGLASDEALWRDQLPVLGARVAAHFADQPTPPCVVTDAHARQPDLPRMAAYLLSQHPGPLLLVGTSMGGILALEVWRQAPQRVVGMALLGTSARPDTPELIALRTQACELFAAGRMQEVLRANLVFAFHPDSLRGTSLLADYMAMMARAGAPQLIAQNQAIMARADSRPMLPRIDCPTLIVCGQDDQLTPAECSQELADGIPGAELHLLPRCGHLLTWEQPQTVNALLLAWLDRCLQAGG